MILAWFAPLPKARGQQIMDWNLQDCEHKQKFSFFHLIFQAFIIVIENWLTCRPWLFSENLLREYKMNITANYFESTELILAVSLYSVFPWWSWIYAESYFISVWFIFTKFSCVYSMPQTISNTLVPFFSFHGQCLVI